MTGAFNWLVGLACECCSVTWLAAAAVFLIAYTLYLNVWYRKLPPHPLILPILGNAFFVIGKRPVERAQEIQDSQGKVPKIVSLSFVNTQFIILNDVGIVRKVFQQESDFTSDRPAALVRLSSGRAQYGIINSPPPTWIHTRRIGLQILRDLGFGKSLIQQSIEDQCEYLRLYLTSQVGNERGFEISNTLSKCSSDIMSLMLFGRKPAMEGGDEVKYVQLIEQFTRTDSRLLIIFPFLRYFNELPVIGSLIAGGSRIQLGKDILKYLMTQIHEHQARLNLSDEPNDFIDHFLHLRHKEKGKSQEEVFTDLNLAATLQDLFIAGTDTTSVTLTWAIALLCHKPEIQEKVYQELYNVFGEAEFPSMSQINDCPYTRAVMSEVLRFGVTAPSSLPHTATKDLEIDGYWIPKDSVILANVFYATRDPALWQHPEDFYPEHFYNASSNSFEPNENLISFSIGRRACLGESLARQEFFMFLGAMLMRFRFEFHPSCAGEVREILAGRDAGIVRSPNSFSLVVHSRQ